MTFPPCSGAWLRQLVISALGGLLLGFVNVAAAAETGPALLLARHAELKDQMARSPYGRPLILESVQSADKVTGQVHAILDSPFAAVGDTFTRADRWCDVMILHINTKYCQANSIDSAAKLRVHIGRKTEQQLSDAFALDFDFVVVSATVDYLHVTLTSPRGPLGTSDYRMEIQAVPLAGGKTFLRLGYSYGYGIASSMAMKTYLATVGKGKVGFTQSVDGGTAGFITGMRGAVERNTMRYFLAIDAYQASLRLPVAGQLDARLRRWFDATEEFPRQLREVTRPEYLAMKKAEIARIRTAQSPG